MFFNISKNKIIAVSFLLLAYIFCLVGCGGGKSKKSPGDDHVTITTKGSHYEVVLNFNNISHYNMGAEYGRKILQTVPDCVSLLDSYLAEISRDDATYQVFMNRTELIKPQIPQEYRDEIDGMASNLSDGAVNGRGDGKLSPTEIYFLNLIPDVARETQCAAMAIFGNLSATGKTMVGRVLDWYQGSQNQMAKLQAVMTFKNGAKSICTIGYLGFMGVLSGFNNDKVFAAILDSSTGSPYSASGKRSYPLDLRYALENCSTMDKVANYMTSASNPYAFSHLIFLANSTNSEVVENNISTPFRQVRTALSALNPGIGDFNTTYGSNVFVGCVNSFILNGNTNIHTGEQANTARWSKLTSGILINVIMDPIGYKVTLNDLKNYISYDGGDGPSLKSDGDLYNKELDSETQQIIVFEPDTFNLQVFFHPVGNLPADPTFESIPVSL